MNNDLIFGKDPTERVVGVEPGSGDKCTLFIQDENGDVSSKQVPMSHWILYTQQHSPKMRALEGDQPFKYIMEYDSREKYLEVLRASKEKKLETVPAMYWKDRESINPKEAFMTKEGVTMYKGLKVEDVSILSFDIETTGLTHDKDSKVLLISNTFRRNGKIVKRLFAYDDYASEADMFNDWCRFVREHDPSIITGHNIFGYDLPYVEYCASRAGVRLCLGRDGSPIKFDSNASKFRKDGSQAYDYNNVNIYGRDVIDTFFLAIKHDVKRKYESYGLKQIIKQEKLEKKDRAFYDAGQIWKNYKDPVEWSKIKAYAMDDADDALALYDKMAPAFFYTTQSIPRTFQQIINTASGGQINSIMVRSYLQIGHSIAKPSEKMAYRGAISFGISGSHKNTFKIDIKSQYPSIMLQNRVENKDKDPKGHFLQLVEHFYKARIQLKKLVIETKEQIYKDLDAAAKIFLNSMYGFLGAAKVHYNFPAGAETVCRIGRELLIKGIEWASGRKFIAETYGVQEEDHLAEDDSDAA